MKTLLKSLVTFFFFSNLAIAGYDCPPASSTAGGWVPPECQTINENEGVVESINKIEGSGDASGVGAVAGAVAGGALGNVAGSKKHKTLSTVLGAVAGGVAGHYGEKYIKKTATWEVTVKMNSGEQRTFSLESEPEYKIGDAVIVSGDTVFKKLQ